MKTNQVKIGLILLVMGLAIAVFFHSRTEDTHVSEIKARASKIFTIARGGQHLPSSQLVALSVALQFKDFDGAESIISRLERL